MLTTIALLATTLLTTPQGAYAPIRDSIEASLVRVAPRDGAALAAQTARLLGWRGDVARHVYRDDTLTIIYEDGDEPDLLALQYKGLKIKLEAFRFADEHGIERFYDADGALVEPAIKQTPVPQHVQITEVVQRGRGKRRHNGIDFKAPRGTPVVLPYDAQIARVNWLRRVNGNCIEAIYGTGMKARFLHLNEVDPAVKSGSWLKAGQRLGTVGSTGRSGPPHLHYEILDSRGRVVDPLKTHGTYQRELSQKRRGAFASQIRSYRKQLLKARSGSASL